MIEVRGKVPSVLFTQRIDFAILSNELEQTLRANNLMRMHMIAEKTFDKTPSHQHRDAHAKDPDNQHLLYKCEWRHSDAHAIRIMSCHWSEMVSSRAFSRRVYLCGSENSLGMSDSATSSTSASSEERAMKKMVMMRMRVSGQQE